MLPEFADLSLVRIETGRLLIRPYLPGDGAALHQAIVDSLASLRRWPASLRWVREDPTKEGLEDYCCRSAEAFQAGRDFPFLMLLRGTEEVVSATGLHDPDWSVPKLEMGWWGRTGYLGQGLVTEGTRAVLEWGFEALGARRIFALTDEENVASCRVCERIGMEQEGRLRHERADPEGRLRTTCVYAAVR